MTIYDKICSTQEELARFLSGISYWGEPWNKWIDDTYCSKCEPIIVRKEDSDYSHDITVGKCEVGECPFGLSVKSEKDVIMMWLNSEQESYGGI